MAAWEKGDINAETASENLISLYGDCENNFEERALIISSTGRINHSSAIPFLAGLVKNENLPLKHEAFKALGKYGDKECNRALASTIGLTSVLSVPTLKKLLGQDPNAVVPTLVAELSTMENGGGSAAEFLGILRAPEAIPHLARIMKADNQRGWGSPQAIIALGRIGGHEAIMALSNELGNGEPANDYWIFDALELVGEDAVPVLKQASHHPYSWIAEAAKESLTRLGETLDDTQVSVSQQQGNAYGFTNDRLDDWYNFITSNFPDFAGMLSKHIDGIKHEIRGFSAFLPTETQYGLLIPINQEKWAIREVNGVTNGALAGLNTRFIIFDFRNHKVFPVAYDRISGMERKNSDLNLLLDNNERKMVFRFNLPIGRKLGWSLFNIAMGMTGAGTSRNDPARRYATIQATRDNSSRANAEANLMVQYIDTVYSYFVEALQGQSSPSNRV